MNYVSQSQICAAQNVNVYDFAINHLADAFIYEGSSLRLRSDHKIFISAGAAKYFDNDTGLPGNGIDLLVRYFGYDFVDAVVILTSYSSVTIQSSVPLSNNQKNKAFVPPVPFNGPYRQLFAYLTSRGIPSTVVQRLINMKLLYQSDDHQNVVFINQEHTYAEIRGTYTFGQPFKQSLGTKAGNFWCVPNIENSDTVFICESAIDAVSLSILRNHEHLPKAVYVSIGGVHNAKAIDKLLIAGKRVIIATDNDIAGQNCRNRFSNLEYVISKLKDWNDDLLKGEKYHGI